MRTNPFILLFQSFILTLSLPLSLFLSSTSMTLAQDCLPTQQHQPKLIIIFGEMGSGKTFAGKLLAESFNLPFFDGDQVIPEAMMTKVREFTPLTAHDINDYVENHLMKKIVELTSVHEVVVVSQALYSNRHRKQIQALQGKENTLFVMIETPENQHIHQLRSRINGEKWLEYAQKNHRGFQPPDDSLQFIVIQNNGDKEHLTKVMKEKLSPYIKLD